MEVFASVSCWKVCFFIVLLVLDGIQATSVASNPLTYLEFVKNPSLRILPRDRFDHTQATTLKRTDSHQESSLRHDDSMRIQFVAFNQTFNLHLEPNLDLFHPEATITIYHANQTSTTTRLIHDDYRLYKGVLLDTDSTDKRLNEDIIGLKRRSLSEELEYSTGVLGWARIQILDDGGLTQHDVNKRQPTFEGTFSLKNDLYHIKSVKNFKISQYFDDPEIPNISARSPNEREATMIIYRDSDTKRTHHHNRKRSISKGVGSCAMDDLISDEYRRYWRRERRHDDAIFAGMEGSGFNNPSIRMRGLLSRFGDGDPLFKRAASGCPLGRKIAYMGAAADCTYVQSYSSPDAARKQILSDWGTASAVYERTFNVTLGLFNIVIQDQSCPKTVNQSVPWNRPCSDSYTIDDRLSDFSQWRGTLGEDGAALWHLMSKCNTGSKVGIAWLGMLCKSGASLQNNGTAGKAYVSGTGVSTIVKDEWKVVAHEIGHGFGAIHDCVASTCPCGTGACSCCPLDSNTCDAQGKYIMNPTSDVLTNDFSPCSIRDICYAFPGLGTCLLDPGQGSKVILSSAMCGNGLKEQGEDCDCGTDCDKDPCCDGSTCKFKNGAVCDDLNDMCCTNCSYKPANTICRPSSSECDIVEYCNGTSGVCPSDAHVADGTSCGNSSGLACANGQCTSRDLQCLQRGSRMGVTKACASDSGSCAILCADPSSSNTCLQMTGNFIDGTPCGFGGTCSQGNCKSGSITDTIKGWFDQYKQFIIPIGIVFGVLILLCILQCIFRCFRRRKVVKSRVFSAPPNGTDPNLPPPANVYNADGQRSAWINAAPYNGQEPTWVDETPYNNNNGSKQPSIRSDRHYGQAETSYSHQDRNIASPRMPYWQH
ncbi:3164_t:CDS:10 [Acaulospora morrowiae]|uniref:Disintegrin and metalloproteinase domain-containing protein B n=1 Tax=Acaulospora morrowiae TaxID=94023 RepID=A0A9N8ZMZ2_9GLOM|nr:3164_t:CDS:10 [Acaulospora morrowiae]